MTREQFEHTKVESTARLPAGWQERLVRFESAGTRGVVAWCLDLHDLWIAKAIAGRPKDRAFCQALLRTRAVEPRRLRERLVQVPALDPLVRDAVHARIPS